MENKNLLVVGAFLIIGIIVGYILSGSKMQTQNQGAASLTSGVNQEVSSAKNAYSNNTQTSNTRNIPTTSQIYPDVSLIFMDAEEMSGQGAGEPTGVFVFKFKITAINGDVYIPNDISALSSLGLSSNVYSIEKKGYGQINQNINAVITTTSGAQLDLVTNNYRFNEGDPEVLTVVASVDLDSTYRGSVLNAGDYRGVLNFIRWNASNSPTTYVDYVPNFITNWLTLN